MVKIQLLYLNYFDKWIEGNKKRFIEENILGVESKIYLIK